MKILVELIRFSDGLPPPYFDAVNAESCVEAVDAVAWSYGTEFVQTMAEGPGEPTDIDIQAACDGEIKGARAWKEWEGDLGPCAVDAAPDREPDYEEIAGTLVIRAMVQ